jgi:chromosome segregation ATPase
VLDKWVIQGLSKLQSAQIKANFRLKAAIFASLRYNKPISPFSQETLERLEFEKAELAINLQNKTDEVNRLVDMLEECKGWENKLTHIETGMRTETEKWKQTAFELQEKLSRKSEEIASLQVKFKSHGTENGKAQREIATLEKELQEARSKPSEEAAIAEAEALRENNEKLSKRVEELEGKLQEQIQETLDSEREKLLLLKKMNEKPSKKAATLPKKTMQLERAEVQEGQLALEIVRLNREVNKQKFEARTAQEYQRKAETERDDLIRQAKLKSDVIEKLRKENEQLSVSLSTDQYKSVQKLEGKIAKLKGEMGMCRESGARVEAEKHSIKAALDQEIDKTRVLEVEAAGLRDQLALERKKAEDATRALNTLNSLQERFIHLKEFGDKQITLTEGMKREKMMLEEQIEGLKANLRATKMHMDKAIGDAEAYSKLLKQMEGRLSDCNAQKQQAEDEVRSLRSRLSKALA